MDVFGFSLLYILHHTKQLDQVHSGVTYPLHTVMLFFLYVHIMIFLIYHICMYLYVKSVYEFYETRNAFGLDSHAQQLMLEME